MQLQERRTLLVALANPATPQLRQLDKVGLPFDVVVSDRLEGLKHRLADADAILCWMGQKKLLHQVVPHAPKLRWVHSMAAGVDGLLSEELLKRDIIVTNSRGVFARSLAEFVVLAILFFAKDVRRMLQQQAEHRWEPYTVEELHGKVAGIIGYGSIGRAVAERLSSFGIRILALRNRPQLSSDDPYVERVYSPSEKLELVRQVDYLIITAPLTPQTAGMIGRCELEALKPEAILINVGRGPVVDEKAMVELLQERRFRGAALDVYGVEPLPEDHPLWTLDNVLLSPHCADHTPTWLDEAMELFVENLRRFIRGEPLRNVVDKRLGY